MDNKLICGDNLEVLGGIEKESVDLIYIDPPFFSNRHYEVVWGDEAEVRSFDDRWEGGMNVYIDWMKQRVIELQRILKPTGSFYLHCDWHAGHYLKVMCDEVFGHNNFQNEIIWWYSQGGKSQSHWARKHDNIFFYSKSPKYNFYDKEIREPFTPHKGSSSGSFGGRMGVDEKGRQYVEKWGTGKKKLYRYYLDEGKVPEDVWQIQSIQAGANERLGYPTQKPEILLERIIKSGSKKGDIVLDCFCGCGTSIVVANRLDRQWIGIDISPTAIKTIEKRLKKDGITKDKNYIATGLPTTQKELDKLKPFEFQNWVIDTMQGRHSRTKTGDMGIDGYIVKDLFRESAGIQVKQSYDVGRNVIDNFKAALDRAKYKKGYIVAHSFGKGSHEEVARLKNEKVIDIELITTEDLLNQKKIT